VGSCYCKLAGCAALGEGGLKTECCERDSGELRAKGGYPFASLRTTGDYSPISDREHIMTDDIRQAIRHETRFLRGYSILMTAAVMVLALAAFQQPTQKTKFTEIDVERINIVEPDGKLRMVISNRPRSIGPIYKGQPFGYAGGTRPGMIFFNDEGSENGGMTISGSRDANGRYRASSSWSFDQFDQDQILTLQYTDNNGQRRTGLTINDRADVSIFDLVRQRDSLNRMPDTPERRAALERLMGPRSGVPLNATRLYAGRDAAKSAVVNLSDATGNVRLRMRVDSLGRASVDFLDGAGRVTFSLPDSVRR
jgi:hypothetical protein